MSSIIRSAPGEPKSRVSLFLARTLGSDPTAVTTGWEDVLIAEGTARWASASGDEQAAAWARRWAAHHLGVPISNQPIHIASYTRGTERTRGIILYDYCGNWGAPLALGPLVAIKDDRLMRETVRTVADFIIDGSLRAEDRVILHGSAQPTVWVDTLYYTAAPLAAAYTVTDDRRYADEAIAQCLLHANHLRDEMTGLFFHDAHPVSGRRTHWFWGRGNGWIVMSLAETLAACPPETPGWNDVLAIYRSLVTGLLRLQHPSGLWRIIPENPDSHLETSGSAMILRGILRGVLEDWLEAGTVSSILRGAREVASFIRPDGPLIGALMGSQRPAGPGGWERHKHVELGECTYTTGTFLALLALLREAGLDPETLG